jgi:SAM-dependent methyltransferase
MPRSRAWRQRRANESSICDGVTNETGQGAGGGFASVHEAYAALGATDFYIQHGRQYSNPHEGLLAEAMAMALDEWESSKAFAFAVDLQPLRVLDVACGSGEATIAFESWLASGANGITRPPAIIDACDPYTRVRYEERTGSVANPWSFAQLAQGVLDDVQQFDLILASFCLHLLDATQLEDTLQSLARVSRYLLVATPHRWPIITPESGWEEAAPCIVHSSTFVTSGSIQHRVRVRLFRSIIIKVAT